MDLNNLSDVFTEQLKDLYSAETQIIEALPNIINRVSNSRLRSGLEAHLTETKGQLERLQQAEKILGQSLEGEECEAIKGILAEGEEILDAGGTPEGIDAALVGACRRVEHYEMAAYCTARGMAEELGHKDISKLLDATFKEEQAADEKLVKVAKAEVFPGANEDSSGKGGKRTEAGALM